MAIGPVQLIVLGFNHPDFHGEVIAELERLHENGMVRVIDSLAVYKDADGDLEVEHLSNLTQEEAIELGSKIGALIGLGIDGEEGMEAGAEAGAEQAAEEGINVFGGDEWDVLEDIPNDSAAALILLEHHWAVPLRDAIARTIETYIKSRTLSKVRPDYAFKVIDPGNPTGPKDFIRPQRALYLISGPVVGLLFALFVVISISTLIAGSD